MDDLLQSPLMSGQGTFAFTRPDSEVTALEGAAFGATFDALLTGPVAPVPHFPDSIALYPQLDVAAPGPSEGTIETPLMLASERTTLASDETPILPMGVPVDPATDPILKGATAADLAFNAQIAGGAFVADTGDAPLRTLPMAAPVIPASPAPHQPVSVVQSVVNQPPPTSSNTVAAPHVAELSQAVPVAKATGQMPPLAPTTTEATRAPQVNAQGLPAAASPEPQTLPVGPERPGRATMTGPLTIPDVARVSPQTAPLTVPPAAREAVQPGPQTLPGVERSTPQVMPQTLPADRSTMLQNPPLVHPVADPAPRDHRAPGFAGPIPQSERTAVVISGPQARPATTEQPAVLRNHPAPVLPPQSSGPQTYSPPQQAPSAQPAEAMRWQSLPQSLSQSRTAPPPNVQPQPMQPIEQMAPAAIQRGYSAATVTLASQAAPLTSPTGAPTSVPTTLTGQESPKEAATIRVGGWTVPAARTPSPYVVVPQQAAITTPAAPQTLTGGADLPMDALPDFDSALQPLLTPASSTALTPTTSLLAHAPSTTAQVIAQQIATALANPSAEGDAPLELALDPPELGRVRMQMAEIAGVMTLTIQAERPETADLMRRHLDLLAQEFSDAGLDSPSVHISQDGAEHQGRDDGDTPTQASAAPTASTPDDEALPRPSRTAAGGLDLRL
ncbi:flagellar hook-length control protein FliK [Gymnodinialimonas sp. 57CJ19]|uniref:flagellar hook-length control protein FliK n=1 Tax=Gymnodinialimonas sp. 57CJ19 TaxID=3138498 RepID=UPI00313450E6